MSPVMKRLLTVREVAERYQVKTTTVYKWIYRREITRANTPGGHPRFDPEDLDRRDQLHKVAPLRRSRRPAPAPA